MKVTNKVVKPEKFCSWEVVKEQELSTCLCPQWQGGVCTGEQHQQASHLLVNADAA